MSTRKGYKTPEALFDLKGRTALVTGSSRGIGKVIAQTLGLAGAHVVLHGSRPSEALDATFEEFKKMGIKCSKANCDISKTKENKGLVKSLITKHKSIDILVLNASLQYNLKWDEITAKDFGEQVNTNMRSTIELIQGFAPTMLKNKWGRIVTIGTVNQRQRHPGFLVYAATKAAVFKMTQDLAKQFAPDGITVNNIAPGAIDTDRNKKALSDKTYLKKVVTNIPAGYIGQASDCAGAALLLCSDAGRYITGADLYVDGGMSLK